MPRHEIESHIPAVNVLNTDMTVIVRSNGKKLGQLTISRGSIDWAPAGYKTSWTMTWEQFAGTMKDNIDGT
jgi:hypothetical protein